MQSVSGTWEGAGEESLGVSCYPSTKVQETMCVGVGRPLLFFFCRESSHSSLQTHFAIYKAALKPALTFFKQSHGCLLT